MSTEPIEQTKQENYWPAFALIGGVTLFMLVGIARAKETNPTRTGSRRAEMPRRLPTTKLDNPKISPPFVHKGTPESQDTYEEHYARIRNDGAVEVWHNVKTELVHPRRDIYVFTARLPSGKRSSLGSSMQLWNRSRMPLVVKGETHYWGMSQFFYFPGDWAHVNGQYVEVFQNTYVKNIALLRKRGLKRISRVEFGELIDKVQGMPRRS